MLTNVFLLLVHKNAECAIGDFFFHACVWTNQPTWINIVSLFSGNSVLQTFLVSY